MAHGVGTKAERDALRHTMQQHGCTTDEIAAEMARRWNFRPRTAWRHVHGWSQREAAARYNEAASDPNGAMSGNRISEYELWPHGGYKPSIKVLFVLAQIYGTTLTMLVDLDDREELNPDERIALAAQMQPEQRADTNTAVRQMRNSSASGTLTLLDESPRLPYDHEFGTTPIWTPRGKHWDSWTTMGEFIMNSAQESSNHAASAEGTNVGPITLEQLSDDVVRLARVGGSQGFLQSFPEIIQTRNLIYRLLDGHQYPRQTTDLYFLASIICGVLADASDCLGYPVAAMEHTRAALTYADIIGHNSLRVWCKLMQATLARDDDRPQHALTLARSGQAYAHSDVCRARLYSIEAQTLALMGDKNGALEALRLTREATEKSSERDDLFDDVAGTFESSSAGRFRTIASGYLQIGMATEAVNAARAGIALYQEGPSEKRYFGNEAGLHINLANAYILNRQLDAAQVALEPVFALPLDRRLSWLGGDMKRFRRTLSRLPGQRSTEFQALQSGVEDFLSSLLSKSIPGTA